MSLTLRPLTPTVLARVPRFAPGAAATAAGFAVLLAGVLAMHGFLPGLSQPMVQTIVDSGAIQCLHNAGWGALTARCDAVGQPIGFTYVLGMPEEMLGWLISWLPGVDAWAAHQILNALLDAFALAGGYLLLRRWSVPRVIALVAPAVYLVSPSLIAIDGFGYTFNGYTFLPLYVYLFLCGTDRFADGRRTWAGVAYLTGLAFLMVFTDGYSYATALVLIGVVLVWWLVRDEQTSRNRKVFAVATFALANVLAVAAYSAYLNVSSSPTVGIGAYRYLGLDIVTLFVPERNLIWPSHLGYHPPELHLWGDGSNYHNYMGFAMLAILAWLLLSRRLRHQPVAQGREIVPLLVAALIALVLSFGPALKFNSQTVPITPSWDVPVSKTVIGLPTAFLFRFVPPFDDMRATYRWSIGFRFVLVFAAAYAIGLIWQSGRRGIAALLLVVSSFEVLPSPGGQLDLGRTMAKRVAMVRSQAIGEFNRLTTPGERVLLLPASNDFLVLAMAPAAGVVTYNLAGDKNYPAAKARWPVAVRAAVDGIQNPTGEGNRIAAVLQHDADAVTICYFSMHTGGTMWPAPDPHQAFLRQEVKALARDPRFTIQQGTLMAVIRLRR